MRYGLILLLLGGCAVNTGIVQSGPDTYTVLRQAATGFDGGGKLKADVMRDAQTHCSAQQKTLEVVSLKQSKPPYILGNFPKAELEFRCVSSAL